MVGVLAELFASAGNQLRATPRGFVTAHEPAHESRSGTCVSISAPEERWYCHSCQQGGGPVEAVMSLHGASRADAEAWLREHGGSENEDEASKKRRKPSCSLRQLPTPRSFTMSRAIPGRLCESTSTRDPASS